MNTRTTLITLLAAVLLLVAISGCDTSTPTPEPPTDTPVPPTATHTSVPPTDTPEPTETPVPTDTPIPTDTATPTPDLAATESYEATQAAEEAMALVEDTLTDLGLSPDSGSLAWNQEGSVSINTAGGRNTELKALNEGAEYETYVLSIDMTWETTTGFAGCGIIFHSEQNIERGRQYRMYTLRLSGLPGWDIELWDNGGWLSTATGKVKYNSAIDQDNDSVNNIVLYVQDGLVGVYANGERLSNVITSSLNEGRIGAFVWQESGESKCTFENGWVWALNE